MMVYRKPVSVRPVAISMFQSAVKKPLAHTTVSVGGSMPLIMRTTMIMRSQTGVCSASQVMERLSVAEFPSVLRASSS